MALRPLYQYSKFWLPAIWNQQRGLWVHDPNRRISHEVICARCKKPYHLGYKSWKPALRHMIDKHWNVLRPKLMLED